MTAAYILNRVSSKSIPSTPYELWGPKGKKCIFIRYLESSKGYIFLAEDINGSVTKIESRDVVFLEEEFLGQGELDRDTHFYEMEDFEVSESVRIIDSTLAGLDNIESLTLLEASGSDNLLDHVPIEQDHEQSQP